MFYRFNKCFKEQGSQLGSYFLKSSWSIALVFLGFYTQVARSQNTPLFSQYMFNALAINPGSAGTSEMINLLAIQRNQYLNLGSGKIVNGVYSADAAFSIFGVQSGGGLNIVSDKIGFIKTQVFELNYSSIIELTKGRIGIGGSLGVYNHEIDASGGWKIGDSDYHKKNDGAIPEGKVSGFAPDFGLGAYFKTERYYAGLSVKHLFNTEPRFNADNYYFYLKRTYYVTGGCNFALNDKPIVFQPSTFIQTDGVSLQADLNVNAVYNKRFWGGLSYRLQDALVFLGGIELSTGLKVGVSYDVPISQSSAGFGGSMELTLGYTFKPTIDKKSKNYKSVRYL